MLQIPRHALIAGGVVLLHVAALWALQGGLARRPAEIVVPVELLSGVVVAPPPEVPPQPPPVRPAAAVPAPVPAAQPPAPEVRRPPVSRPPAPAPRAPRPVTAPAPVPAPAAPARPAVPAQPVTPAPGTPAATAPTPAPAPTSPAPAAPAPESAAAAASPAPATAAIAPAPPLPSAPAPAVELPISDADYLHNPPPAWPRLSERLGETGVVIVRVLIGTDGRARRAEVGQSSGYQRLDKASVAAALSWRYVPGKRGGVPEEMWVNVPIRWGQ